MSTREDLNYYSSASSRIVTLAQKELEKFWARIDHKNPAQARDLLLDFVPALVSTFGDVAAAAAADWYEQLRAKAVSSSYRAVTAGVVAPDQVQASVRYAAGHLFTGDPGQALSVINGAVQRYVQYSGRETVARNVAGDKSRPRFARVPQGAITCAFCSLVASRGFVYHSKKSAGETNHYHDDCDCQIVPSWDKSPHIEGYDPEELYGQYRSAREQFGGVTAKEVTQSMRRAFPESYTDGVVI